MEGITRNRVESFEAESSESEESRAQTSAVRPVDVAETSRSSAPASASDDIYLSNSQSGGNANSYTVRLSVRRRRSQEVQEEAWSCLVVLIAFWFFGKTGLNEWIEDPSYPNASLSWNNVHGTGSIEYMVDKDAEYYIAIGNLNPHNMEMYLNFKFNGILYDTTKAKYKCPLQNDLCGVKLFLLGDSYAVLTTPGPKESGERDEWYARLSYGPRWLTYLVGSGGLTIVILVILKCFAKFNSRSGEAEVRSEHLPPERTPLISQKDDDDSSCGSSHVSLSVGEDNDEETHFPGSPRGEDNDIKSQKSEIYQRRLCAICYDASRDSFFLPCGHCATCFTCGMRISEETNMCPICRKKIRKVRKIFAV
uniref:RING-type domain-containing protein n=1 Tax=Araucaria cunninghamii TaxID=56994 RepID=A0A0D6QXU7_ARACU